MKRKVFVVLIAMICAGLVIYHFIPFSYIVPHYHIEIQSCGYDLSKGYMGLKVYEVKKKLNLSLKNAKYDDETIEAIKKFQGEQKLEVTGNVNLNTWLKLGLSQKDWYDLECYVTPCKVNENSSREERIEAMVETAKEYIGTKYIVGASGKPQSGVDCSGLIIQVMYSIGLDPTPISPIRHSQPEYEYESYSLWKHKHIQHYSFEDREKGDLIFFKNKNGRVNHVGLYIGNNQIIEATGKDGVVLNTLTDKSIKNVKCMGRLL